MTALLLQTLLLMGSAFFIGAALACGLRQLLQPAQDVMLAPVHGQPAAVEPLPQYTARAASPVATNPAELAGVPVAAPAAKPAVTAPTSAPAAASAPVNRFDDTLRARAVDAAAPPPSVAPAVRPAEKPVEAVARPAPPPPPAPATPIAPRPQPSAAPTPMATPTSSPTSSPTARPASVAPTPAMVAGAAAAMAAAAAAVTSQATSAAGIVATKTMAQAPQAQPPLAAGAAAVATPPAAATSAIVVPPNRDAMNVAKAADDLTRISVIDATLGAQLNKLGITRFSQIAGWRKADVDQISQSLGFIGRIEQENWIEQAQILAGGGETFYSARRNKAATPAPTVASGSAPRVDTAAPTALNSASATVAGPIPAAAASHRPTAPTAPEVELRAAFAQQKLVTTATLPLPPDRTAVPAALSTAPATGATTAAAAATATAAATAAEAAAASAAAAAVASAPKAMPSAAAATVPMAAPPSPPAPQSPPVPLNAPVATAMRPAMAATRDALQRIGVINAEVERLLATHGVTRYSQIGGWGAGDIERFDRLLGSQGRIGRENWVEQAQILAKGGDTVHSREFDRRHAEVPRAEGAARPVSITEAIKANATATPAAAPIATASANPAAPLVSKPALQSRPDISALRSVRAEVYRSDSATAAAAAAAAGMGSAKVVRSAEIDDLKRIRGIGVLIEKRLNSVGIVSYGQIAEWTNEDIDRVSATLDFKGRIERENWVEQARILSAGGQTEFSRRVDRGEVETSRSK